MLHSNLGEIAALGTAICWSLSATFFELSGKKVGSLAVNYIRLITGFIFISIFTYFTRGYLLPIDASTKNWIFLSISGLIGFFIGDLFLFQSYLEIGSRVSMLIMATSPPITALLSFLIFGEKLSLLNILGMAITLTGIAIVILSKGDEEKKVKVTYSVKGLTYLILYTKKFEDIKKAFKNKNALLYITIGSIFGPFVGVGLSLLSLQYTSAGISSTITSITPVTIIPLSVLVFKDKIKIKEIMGALITVIGVAILFLF